MDHGRLATAVPRRISRLDEDSMLRSVESHSGGSRAQRATPRHSASTSPGAAIAFAKLPTEAIELYVFGRPIHAYIKHIDR
jgi:hypothetical protein